MRLCVSCATAMRATRSFRCGVCRGPFFGSDPNSLICLFDAIDGRGVFDEEFWWICFCISSGLFAGCMVPFALLDLTQPSMNETAPIRIFFYVFSLVFSLVSPTNIIFSQGELCAWMVFSSSIVTCSGLSELSLVTDGLFSNHVAEILCVIATTCWAVIVPFSAVHIHRFV